MRVLSARILRPRRNRDTGRVEAVVAMTVLPPGHALPLQVRLGVSAPARAAGGATLRHRLLAAAKLAWAAGGLRSRRARDWAEEERRAA
jgi:hypothetical protein